MPPSPDARAQFHEPAALSAASVLTPDMLAGAYHEVADETDNDGFFNRCTVNSPFGTCAALTNSALGFLINEIYGIAEMKKVKTDDTATESLRQSGANTVSGIKDLFTDMLLFIGHGTQIRGFDSLGGDPATQESKVRTVAGIRLGIVF